MIERVTKGRWHGSRESQEFLVIAGVACDEVFRNPIGAHRPPFVMISVAALSEPDLSQVFEAPIAGDVSRRDVAMIIEDGLCLSELEIQPFAGAVREQKILGKKGVIHR